MATGCSGEDGGEQSAEGSSAQEAETLDGDVVVVDGEERTVVEVAIDPAPGTADFDMLWNELVSSEAVLRTVDRSEELFAAIDTGDLDACAEIFVDLDSVEGADFFSVFAPFEGQFQAEGGEFLVAFRSIAQAMDSCSFDDAARPELERIVESWRS